jgi:hypothetical protein
MASVNNLHIYKFLFMSRPSARVALRCRPNASLVREAYLSHAKDDGRRQPAGNDRPSAMALA